MISIILLVVALILFVLAAVPVAATRFNLGWLGAAFLTGALLLRWGAL